MRGRFSGGRDRRLGRRLDSPREFLRAGTQGDGVRKKFAARSTLQERNLPKSARLKLQRHGGNEDKRSEVSKPWSEKRWLVLSERLFAGR